MKKQATVTVHILCMVVDSDGTPVDEHCAATTKPRFEWDRRRIATSRVCPIDLADPHKRAIKYHDLDSNGNCDAKVVRCKCHNKFRMIMAS